MSHHCQTKLHQILFSASIVALVISTVSFMPARGALSLDWLTQYGTSGFDFPQGIAVDASGQSWVAGSFPSQSLSLSRISATGSVDFTQSRGAGGAEAVALLGNGTVFTGGYATAAFDGETYAGAVDNALLRYNTSGVWQGTKLFGGAGTDHVLGLAANATNLFSAGFTSGSFGGVAGGKDGFLTKHDATGNLLWKQFIGSSSDDQAQAVALDTVGNAYVAGYTVGSLPGFTNAGLFGDIFIAKYDTNGNRTLLRQFGSDNHDVAYAIKLDVSGNLYVSGSTSGNLGGQTHAGGGDAFVTKLDSAGNVIWTKFFGGSNVEEALALDLDSNGNVWIGGYSASSFGGHTARGNDAYVAEYDTDGNLLGSMFLATGSSDFILGLSVGPDGAAYVTGRTEGTLGAPNAGGSDVFVAKITGVPEPGSAVLMLFGVALCFRRNPFCTHGRNTYAQL